MAVSEEKNGSNLSAWAAFKAKASQIWDWGGRPVKNPVTPAICAVVVQADEAHVKTRAGKLGGPAAQADAEQFAKDVHEGHYFQSGLDQLDGMYQTVKFGLTHPIASAEARIDEISDEAKLIQKTFNENLNAPAKGKLCK